MPPQKVLILSAIDPWLERPEHKTLRAEHHDLCGTERASFVRSCLSKEEAVGEKDVISGLACLPGSLGVTQGSATHLSPMQRTNIKELSELSSSR